MQQHAGGTAAVAAGAQQPEAWNMRLVGHTDLDGHGDGMHVNVANGYAYVGHMGQSRIGTSVVDVRDPRHPRLVAQLTTPPGTHSHKVQVVDNILVVNHEQNQLNEPEAPTWSGGIHLYDVSKPEQPRHIGSLPMPGKGVHRMTYWQAPYAYMSGSDEGWLDQFLVIADLSDPTHPREVGRWWFPGQHTGGGETPSWTPAHGHAAEPGRKRVALHHPLIRDNRAYCGWWDAGLVILDISDLSNPTLVSHLDFGSGVSGCTHTALPLPGRPILVVTDEQTGADGSTPLRYIRVVDVSDERQPRVIATLPTPQGDYATRGGRFGPHNLHEMRPGSLHDPNTVYATYFNAGVRVYDVSDAANPREIAYYVPEAPPGRASIQLNDLLVDADGLVYVTDRYAGGLYILERTG